MTQLYDLCLTLTPPPADAPEGTIANVEVRCDALGLQPMTAQPLRDPFTPEERRELEWYLETYWQWPYEEFARRGQRVEQLLTDAGQRLYRAVFDQAQTIVQPWRLLPDAQRQLSIISNVPPALSLPYFYQQRPLTFVVPPSGGSGQFQNRPPEGGTTNMDLPPAPRYGFTGRARELHQIERWLLRGSAVVVHGFGGMGKTAIAREAADWLTRTGMYQTACFVSFEHGGDAAMLLSALGHRLGVDFDSRETDAALGRLRVALKQRPTLVIADNLESILPGGDAPLDAPLRAQLWDVLLQLGKAGAGVIITGRDAQFGDGRMAHGKEVKHLELGGLHPEDAYALAVQLFEDLDIPQSRAPYPKLRDLLVQLDHLPLAIQLVLPALGEVGMTIDRLSTEFAALLPRFSDDRETGRNRSLLASLEYSLRRLSKWHQQIVIRLAPFEGGASEDNLLAITEIAEEDWMRLRPALERVALISPEWVGDFKAPFLRFHPVLAPYLRTQPGAEDAALRSRYAACYHAVANYLYHEDNRDPLAVRELARRELPNLRQVLERLLDDGALDQAAEMQEYIARFLDIFGLWRELDELRRRVDRAVAAAGQRTGGALTRAEYLRESGVGEDEFRRGNLSAAYARFTALRERIEALPAGAPLGPGSYQHCMILGWLARCLGAGGQPGAAETLLRLALEVIEALLAAQPENQVYIRERGVMLTDLGNVLTFQGSYAAAQAAYEARLESAEQLGDTRGQGAVLGQLGTLALRQLDYATARQRYRDALQLFQTLDEPAMEVVFWHQLGIVAQEQREWAEAERCYRASLEISEWHGDAVKAATTCNQLAIVAVSSDRPAEAEGWFKRALNAPDLPLSEVANYSNNLAALLIDEVHAGRMPAARLAEARGYAERALEIRETLDASSEIWMTLSILAGIAEQEGEREAARSYHRRERESFAAFAGNRWHIDQIFGAFIRASAAASLVVAALPQLEASGLCITTALRRIWAGERDWHALAEDLDWTSALLVLRVLETIEEMKKE
jgi:tetratricopeptide (TPR) repeat protein